jgi:hypothetical protein
MVCEVTREGEVEAMPYELVVPYSTVDVAASFVVQVMVAVVFPVVEATEEITGGVTSAAAAVVKVRSEEVEVLLN